MNQNYESTIIIIQKQNTTADSKPNEQVHNTNSNHSAKHPEAQLNKLPKEQVLHRNKT